ncbi:hypothetical protein [Mesorhizobium retamae]|uniref:Uncharacterized protein n=1 Tax=Mesorhizobium retamae TaxID=2912854 RepID=A0ABS9QN16_9HYPH|nr:hypothetical protein [Mesorhizobium sp. IRAMC:0171]MCG7508848.1 hypothetical protein [Mesorhizobium sp. IRAMC:0171]
MQLRGYGRSQKPQDITVLVMEIERWEWQYSLSRPRLAQHEVLDEGTELVLFGSMKIDDGRAIRKVELRCLPKGKITSPDQWEERPYRVGDLYRGRSDFDGVLFIGSEALPSVIAMLAMGLYRKLDILAYKVDRQHMVVEHYEFQQTTRGSNR